ncbi:MAG: hypothetical protein ACI8PT_000659, partial [Gammaproteobacteria bacterium]
PALAAWLAKITLTKMETIDFPITVEATFARRYRI